MQSTHTAVTPMGKITVALNTNPNFDTDEWAPGNKMRFILEVMKVGDGTFVVYASSEFPSRPLS